MRAIMSTKLAVAVVMLVVSAAASVRAEPWSRHVPFTCRTVYPTDQPHVYFWAALISTLPYTVTLICPIPDTSERPDSLITQVQVHLARTYAAPSYSIRACRTARTGLASTCGPPAVSSTQTDVITLDPGSIWEPTDFGYLEVTIGAAANPPNTIEGYILVY
jgi:hypothetical protein